MRLFSFLIVSIYTLIVNAQEKPFKDIAENMAMYVQSVEHQPSLKNHKQFFQGYFQRERKLAKDIVGKTLPVRLTASKAYKLLGEARIDDVVMSSKPAFKMHVDLELQNANEANVFWYSNLEVIAYNEHGCAVAVGLFNKHYDDDDLIDLVVVTDNEKVADNKEKYPDKRVTCDISLTMTPWNAREFGNITRIQIVNADKFPEVEMVKKRDKQWKDLFKAGKRYTDKRLLVNILGGPKIIPFMGVDLRCDINDFITAMKSKGYNFSEPSDGYCICSTTVTTQIDGRRADITAYASPTTHIVAWVHYTEEGFKTKVSAEQRLSQLKNKIIDELGLNFIIEGNSYVWHYGYVSFECKEFNLPNRERVWYIVVNVFDHPAYCPYKRELYKCLKELKQQPSIPKEPSDIIVVDEPEIPTIGDPRMKPGTTKRGEQEIPSEPTKKGNEKNDNLPPTKPVPPPPHDEEEVKRDVTWNPTLLQLCNYAMRNNDVEKIQEDLTNTGLFRLSMELFGSGMEGSSSKYPDCDVLVKSKSKKSKELKLLKVTIRKKDINSIRKEFENLGYEISEREKSDLESFHYYYYEKGNKHVEIEEVTSHEYDVVHCNFTIRENK